MDLDGAVEFGEAQVTGLELLDHRTVDWARVQRTAYLIHQGLRYQYPGPIRDLHHRLVIVPPERYGDQERVMHRVSVSEPSARTDLRVDDFGNLVLDITVARVSTEIAFEAWIVVERRPGAGPVRHSRAMLRGSPWLRPSPLTVPDSALRVAAARLQATGLAGLELADAVCAEVHAHLTYGHGMTGVNTTAAEAFALAGGVCQDYSHVMISICRELGLAARYVSGHLLGEGGTHAWVEVLVAAPDGTGSIGVPFDPTHARRGHLGYITVALGRDYLDVAPTSGSFRARHGGLLSSRRRVSLTAVDYVAETA